jgi:hypothetical protein
MLMGKCMPLCGGNWVDFNPADRGCDYIGEFAFLLFFAEHLLEVLGLTKFPGTAGSAVDVREVLLILAADRGTLEARTCAIFFKRTAFHDSNIGFASFRAWQGPLWLLCWLGRLAPVARLRSSRRSTSKPVRIASMFTHTQG